MSEIADRARQMIRDAGKEAQYASKMTGDLSDARAFAIIRQLAVTVHDTSTTGDMPPVRSAGNGNGHRTPPAGITEPQLRYINSMRRQLGRSELSGAGIRKSDASRMIEDLQCDLATDRELAKRAPRTAAPAKAKPELGMYRFADGIYRVQYSRQSDGWYVKELTSDGLRYAGQPRGFATGAVRMTLEEAKAYGRETGQCCCCGALLTDPKSVAAGIGPICGGRV